MQMDIINLMHIIIVSDLENNIYAFKRFSKLYIIPIESAV